MSGTRVRLGRLRQRQVPFRRVRWPSHSWRGDRASVDARPLPKSDHPGAYVVL